MMEKKARATALFQGLILFEGEGTAAQLRAFLAILSIFIMMSTSATCGPSYLHGSIMYQYFKI